MDNKGFLDSMESGYLSRIFEIACAINRLIYPRKIYNLILSTSDSASGNKGLGSLTQNGTSVLEWNSFEEGNTLMEDFYTKTVINFAGINPHHFLNKQLYNSMGLCAGTIVAIETPEHICDEPCFRVIQQSSLGEFWQVSRIHLGKQNPLCIIVR